MKGKWNAEWSDILMNNQRGIWKDRWEKTLNDINDLITPMGLGAGIEDKMGIAVLYIMDSPFVVMKANERPDIAFITVRRLVKKLCGQDNEAEEDHANAWGKRNHR